MDDVDWSGVAKDSRPVPPLTAETFVQRLRLLSARVSDIRVLRAAMQSQKKS
jgi:hypothetical protein